MGKVYFGVAFKTSFLFFLHVHVHSPPISTVHRHPFRFVLIIIRAHKFIPQHIFHKPVVRGRVAPRLAREFPHHCFCEAGGPLIAWECGGDISDCGGGDEVRVEAYVVWGWGVSVCMIL
jgi:hypothetical protein